MERIVDPKYRFAFSSKTGRPYYRKCYWEKSLRLHLWHRSRTRRNARGSLHLTARSTLHRLQRTAGQHPHTASVARSNATTLSQCIQQQISSSNLCRQHLCTRTPTRRRTPRRTHRKKRSGNRRSRFSNHDQAGHRRRAWQLCFGRNHALSRPRRTRRPNPGPSCAKTTKTSH